MGARINQNKPIIVYLRCERYGCCADFALTSRKPSQRYCSHECYAADISPKPYPREMFQSPIYYAWSGMKTRCNDPNFKQYADYGGRGITVCERWSAFANFLEDMGPTWRHGLSLDRIDNGGDYTPDNCRWADEYQQARNKRNTRRFEHDGEQLTLAEWAERTGVKRGTLAQRVYSYKWPIERCLTTPVKGEPR